MRVAVLTREFPPFVYGGAGVHVDFLVRELRRQAGVEVDVHALGDPRPGASAYSEDDPRLQGANPVLSVLSADVVMAAALDDADVVHSHTWYANAAGHLAALLHGVPHVVTAHSLEPKRPWKAEQLGGGYRVSSWIERTAFEAADVYRPDPGTDVVAALGVDLTRPYVTFVGRITRQKGVPHLLRAALRLPPEIQLVLLAGAADTPELACETDELVARLRSERTGVVVVSEMLPREHVRQVLTHAAAFCCPSVYEPLGIVNLEAMACETAVVASAVGGIPEVVAEFGWPAVAARTVEVYRSLP